jgi:hypothetical protein
MVFVYSEYSKRLSSHVGIADSSRFDYCSDVLALKINRTLITVENLLFEAAIVLNIYVHKKIMRTSDLSSLSIILVEPFSETCRTPSEEMPPYSQNL